MVSTKEILNNVDVIYDGVELNKIKALKEYGDFLCDVIDSEEKHITAVALHTGSKYYQVIAIAVTALGCLFYHNTDNVELINSLSIGDMLIIDGQRVRFQGIKDGGQLGVGFKNGVKYFLLEYNHGTRAVQLENASKLNISLYQGNSDSLGGQGIKATLKSRKEFLSAFIKDKSKAEISTEINHSVAVILDRSMADQFYRGIYFNYNNQKVALSDIVTATYYSDEESYQIGSNPTKEEPILKFYSKISVCRDAIIDDRQKRIIGCLICEEDVWVQSSEICDIADRKGLKYSLLSGKTHYVLYNDWYEEVDYKYFASVPETVRYLVNDEEFKPKTYLLKKELVSFANRNIIDVDVKFDIEQNVFEIKRRLLKIKQERIVADSKDDFLLTSYFLLNLCRSAIFPLYYCDKANQKGLINWTVSEKVESLKKYINTLIGISREDAQFVHDNLSQMVSILYKANPKGEMLKQKIANRQADYIVVTKAYYEHLLALWLDECNIQRRPTAITVSAFEKSREVLNNVIFSTVYFDFSFNPYASFNFANAAVLLYEYENCQAGYLKKTAEKGRQLLHDRNFIPYDIIIEPEKAIVDAFENDEEFENEMEKMAKDLLLNSAYHNISTFNNTNGGTAKIEKIITFASGCVGYFTKYYKGYMICGEEVLEVDLDEMKVGDSIVFTKQSENKDIVDLLLNKLLSEQYKNTEYPEYYRLSTCWKDALRKFMKDTSFNYQDMSNLLRLKGCEKHQVTIRTWLLEETHIVGPRSENDFEAIINLVGLNEASSAIKKGCDEIRRLRMRILDELGKAIIRGMFTDKKDAVSELVYKEAGNLTQIEQITSISDSGTNASVPIYMINKPYNT